MQGWWQPKKMPLACVWGEGVKGKGIGITVKVLLSELRLERAREVVTYRRVSKWLVAHTCETK
jgi:hypothetical protein